MKLTDTQFTRIAKALADPQRCELLERTAAAGELCCSQVMAECAVSQATISHHFKELTTAGLLERRKKGQFAYFQFSPEVMSAYLEELGRRMRLGSRSRKFALQRRPIMLSLLPVLVHDPDLPPLAKAALHLAYSAQPGARQEAAKRQAAVSLRGLFNLTEPEIAALLGLREEPRQHA